MYNYLEHFRPGTLQQSIYQCALEASTVNEFSIEGIRWRAYFEYDLVLSYKQVRNALFRMKARGALPIRHIARGTYKWELENS